MKKFLALLIMAVMTLSMVPCFAEAEVPTFVITTVTNTLVSDYEDNYYTKWIEETYGCNLEFQLLPAGDDGASKLNVMVASGEDLGDLYLGGMSQTQIMTYADAGAILPMTKYFEGENNLSKLSEIVGIDLVSASKDASGENWFYPGYYPEIGNMTKYRAWINEEWLVNLGLEMPTTPDELYEVLKAFKEQDANGNGDPNDEIPMLGNSNTWSANPMVYLTNAFIYWDDTSNMTVTDGKLEFAYHQEAYRDALKYMNKLVEEGLLVADTFTISNGQYREYLSTDPSTVGVLFYTSLSYVGPTEDFNRAYEYLPYMIGADGEQRVSVQPYDVAAEKVFFIPSTAKDPDASFALADWLFSEESFIRARFGVEGIHYEKTTDPEVLEKLQSKRDFAIIEGADGWGESNNMSWQMNIGGHSGAHMFRDWNGDPEFRNYKRLIASLDMLEKGPAVGEYVPTLSYTVEENEKRLELAGEINTYWQEMRTRFVLGELDINDDALWAEYISTLDSMGIAELTAIEQAAFDRYFGIAE